MKKLSTFLIALISIATSASAGELPISAIQNLLSTARTPECDSALAREERLDANKLFESINWTGSLAPWKKPFLQYFSQPSVFRQVDAILRQAESVEIVDFFEAFPPAGIDEVTWIDSNTFSYAHQVIPISIVVTNVLSMREKELPTLGEMKTNPREVGFVKFHSSRSDALTTETTTGNRTRFDVSENIHTLKSSPDFQTNHIEVVHLHPTEVIQVNLKGGQVGLIYAPLNYGVAGGGDIDSTALLYRHILETTGVSVPITISAVTGGRTNHLVKFSFTINSDTIDSIPN